MCLFPTSNLNFDSIAYKKGVREFECGSCPECLSKRSSRIMLRDVYEAKAHLYNCMITLTYDQYVRDAKGHVIGERVVDKKVDVRDCQLFIKRLRQYVWRHYGIKIKYRLSAEYGKKTHRPHYHALIFGFSFPDARFYKKSKRGSIIRKSVVLDKLWRHGICTVDCLSITPAVAKYCSKYTSKDKGAEDTFSLCSNGIGLDELYKDFNGLYYTVEGRRYPVPRQIWERYIMEQYSKYPTISRFMSPKYVPINREDWEHTEYYLSQVRRRRYRQVRDMNSKYKRYIAYWKSESERFQSVQLPVFQRIDLLPEDKYHFYKIAARDCLRRRHLFIPAIAPRSACVSNYNRWFFEHFGHLPFSSCLKTASDTLHDAEYEVFRKDFLKFLEKEFCGPFLPRKKRKQLNFFDLFNEKLLKNS